MTTSHAQQAHAHTPPRYGITRRICQSLAGVFLLMLPLAAQAAPRTILAYGDSLSAGYQLKPGEGFAPQLESALRARGHDVKVIMGAVSGDTTTQGRARMDWTLSALKTRPDIVILELGANDMLRGQPPAIAKTNLQAMIRAFRARGSRVLLAGMLAQPNLGKAYQQEFNALYPALAKAEKVPLYPFFMEGVAAVPGMQLEDGLHPTPKGVKVIVNGILPLVEAELKTLKP
jgi:acyl-CoA thioesterase-1